MASDEAKGPAQGTGSGKWIPLAAAAALAVVGVLAFALWPREAPKATEPGPAPSATDEAPPNQMILRETPPASAEARAPAPSAASAPRAGAPKPAPLPPIDLFPADTPDALR